MLERWAREFFSNSTRKLLEELRALIRLKIILTNNKNWKKRNWQEKKLTESPNFWTLKNQTLNQRHQSSKKSLNKLQ